ncbi:Transposase [Thermoplasmatales archaeon]|nr:Transposase [Thermoplasmatales archaeon]QRF76540.1 Transposase [Thermoplasmatales archaeon]
MSLTVYIMDLENTVERLTAENSALKNENEELKRRILIYENPHTPSSRQMFKPKDIKPPGKRGAPPGHKGATREFGEPDEIIHVSEDKCPRCSSPLGSPIRTEKRTIFDIPPPQKIKVTEYDLDVYRCSSCGTEVKSKHRDCPQTGDMGIYLLNYITMLKYNLRGPVRKVQEFISTNNDLDLSVKGINDALLRVGDSCRNEYSQIQDRIRRSKWVHIDETGFHVNGKKYWLWAFRSAENEVLVVITDSRGRDVVKETMGEDFHGPAIVDGWKVYSYLTTIQRCWAHLIREADAFRNTVHGSELSGEIHSMFGELKKSLESGDMDERRKKKEAFDGKMKELVELYNSYSDLHKPVEYIRNGLGSWFTCLLYNGMEPTNNLAEQAIREHVVIRKIIGTFRSESGSRNYQYIASLLSTWRMRGMNMFVEMDKILRKELCGFG